MALMRVKKESAYERRKCKIMSNLIRQKWNEEKRAYRSRKKSYTHIAPPVEQVGAGVPPSPMDLQIIAQHIKENRQQPMQSGGGGGKEMEIGTLV